MAEATIGEAGARLCGAAYVFIHYALLVAYFLQVRVRVRVRVRARVRLRVKLRVRVRVLA